MFSVVRWRSRGACQAALSSAGVCLRLLSIVGFAVTSAVNAKELMKHDQHRVR
jgi:hypothetical protein